MDNVNTSTYPDIPIRDRESCDSQDATYTYSLNGCSGFIIILLALLERRSNKNKCGCLGGHPGLVIPVNLLDHNNDRISFAAAFGSMASVCFKLFTTSDNFADLKNIPTWSKTLYVMATVAVYGLLYYPVFACLSTKWVFAGSFLGAGFSSCLFVLNLKTVLDCAGTAGETLPGQTIATQVPVLVCLCYLILRFTWKFCHHTYLTIKSRQLLEQEERRLSDPHNATYVKDLLYTAPYTTYDEHAVVHNLQNVLIQSRKKAVLRHIKGMVYKNDPTFKYSPKIIAIFVVAIICIYQVSIIVILLVNLIYKLLQDVSHSQNSTSTSTGSIESDDLFEASLFLKVFMGSVVFSFIVCLLFTLWSAVQILTNYRTILKNMFKGDFKAVHFKRSDFFAQTILSYCLSYAGSQIAYLLWGYIISLVSLTLFCIIVTYIIILPITGEVSFNVFKYVVLNILPGFLIFGLFRGLQFLWSRLLIQKIDTVNDTGQPTKKGVLALNNRKAYHNVTFFLFLFYIVLGIFGCFYTILKGIVLGIVYLSRLDRCRLMSGFESFDAAYLYFISFMYVEESHRHPVLLVFCDIMLEKQRTKKGVKLNEFISDGGSSYSTFDATARIGRSLSTLPRARLRWLKAYTLLRNPSLVVDDDHGFEKVEHKSDLSNGSILHNMLL